MVLTKVILLEEVASGIFVKLTIGNEHHRDGDQSAGRLEFINYIAHYAHR